ncbi:protein trichome birefringence-like 19 [Hibiscus syriacus]|uniref:protein trichome birefringence-like 19 n=1 Tax=Hibiscus syriacus TaxID=106335 RepID=UPI0019219284|nr:protein trichome birefringence-like 19 [Hibiscus syriacus]
MDKSPDKTVFTEVFIFTLSLILISSITLSFLRSSHSHLPISCIPRISDKTCDVFKGKWVPYPQGPYYSNETCRLIVDQHNCMKFGRPDTEFMKWRWKPDECQLPLFDAAQFLEIARGKSMAFVGDSVARNQMESLLCLLAH